ncbi:MAG: TetR/AcrR family transcriptional regulator [Chitinophagaceae bacterium]|nr:MAG: TetR/AcrR family transcriptional regulator [Chitinophagaceae bacterium]
MPKLSNKRNNRKDVILNSAAILFKAKGYAATSMRDLAEEVGIEAASLYNHISGKAQILEEIIEKIANDCLSDLQEIEKTDVTSLNKIELFLRAHIKLMIYRFEEYFVMVNEWIQLENDALQNFINNRKRYIGRVESILQDGINKGEIKNLLPYTVVLNLLSCVRGLEFWHRTNKTYTAEDMENSMVEQLIGGLRN